MNSVTEGFYEILAPILVGGPLALALWIFIVAPCLAFLIWRFSKSKK